MSKVVLGLVQMGMDPEPELNREKARALMSEAKAGGAEIICLPELFVSPYFCNSERASRAYQEPVPGPTFEMLKAAARDLLVTVVGGSIYEAAVDGKLYNTSLIFGSDGRHLGTYRKMHIPQDPSFYEKNYFEEGDLGFQSFQSSRARIAPLICYDQWFPEAARSVKLLGAEILFYPTAIAVVDGVEQTEGNWQEAWENVMRGHAIANSVIVAAVNRVGNEGASHFWGGSFICDAFGKTLCRAGDGEEILLQEVDLAHGPMVQEGWGFMRNRRPATYRALVED